ncbi:MULTISPECIES: shikimate kinase [unclassified Meiothermus]|uniref:shikimate kinase n=1 Tax=unclassified Meiothermus TaxID=370471 RepID=UPI002103C5D0|nr:MULTISPECIES: shikimate kinase [unclassified Meiothermus]
MPYDFPTSRLRTYPPAMLHIDRPTTWVSLTGFMGVGKSRIGRELAHELMLHFIDLDGYIERETGLTIADIFRHLGEETFRRLEAEAVGELVHKDFLVLSLGGGTFMNPENRQKLLNRGLVVALWASPQTIFERVGRKPGKRPMLEGGDPLGRIQQIFLQREPIYRQAHLHVSTDGRRVQEVVKEIVGKLWEYTRLHPEFAPPPTSPTSPPSPMEVFHEAADPEEL